MADRSVVVRLILAAQSYMAGVAAAGAATKTLARDLEASASKGRKGMDDLSRGTTVVGAAMLGMAGYAVKAFADFDAAMAKVQANSHATATEMDALRQAAFNAGSTTAYSATQAAGAQDELAKAGYNARQIVASLPGVLSLAAAGQVDLGAATEITVSTLKQFNLDASKAGHVADVLAAGADKSLADVLGLAEALKYTAPTASALGVSLEETIGTLAMFADRGMQGSIAGTTLNDVLLRTIPRSGAAGKSMAALGLQFFDAQGRFVGIAGAAEQLHLKLAKLTDAGRLKAMKTIFGVEGMKGAKYLYEQGAAGVDEYTHAVDAAGFAAHNAAIKMDNLKGDVKKLASAIQTDFIQAGSGANGALRGMAQVGTAVAKQFGSMPAALQQATVWTTGLTGAALAAAGAWGTLAPKVADARNALAAVGPMGERANTMLGKLGKAVGVAAAAFVAVEMIGAAVKALDDTVLGATPGIEQFTAALRQLGDTGTTSGLDRIGISSRRLQDDLRRLTDKSGWEKFTDTTISALGSFAGKARDLEQATRDFQGMDQALAAMVQSGNAAQAASVVAQLGVSADQARSVLPGYTDAIAGAANAAQNSVGGNRAAASAMGDVQQQAALAAQAVKAYVDALKGMTPGGQLMQDTIAMNKTLADTKTAFQQAGKAVLDHSGNLNLTTTSGQQATTSLIAVAQSIRAVASDMRIAGASEEEANAKLNAGRTAFLQLAAAAGLGSAAASELADSLGLIPVKTDAVVATPGAVQSTKQVTDLRGAIRILQGKIVTAKAQGMDESSRQVRELRGQIAALQGRVVDVFVNTYKTQFISTVDNGGRGGAGNTLGGVLPARAGGGPVRKGQMYLVGEQGPEFMVAKSDGVILPADTTAALRSGSPVADDIAARFGGSMSWQGGNMSAPTVATTGGDTVADLSPRAEATLAALAGRVVRVEATLKLADNKTLAYAVAHGQRDIDYQG